MPTKYIKYAFAVAGDKTAIPNTTQVDGSVSYQEGFGFDYQRAKTDPLAKNIPRNQTNELFADLSGAIKQYQENAFPDWITTADNDGVAYPYRVGDYVRYTDGVVYRSLVAANVAVPGTDATKWAAFLFTSSNAGSGYVVTPSGVIIQWGQGVTTTGNQDTVTFPLAFPTACGSVVVCEGNAGGWGAGPGAAPTFLGASFKLAATFKISSVSAGGPSYAGGITFNWIALGY